MSSQNNDILSLSRETFESSSIHGIPNIIKNKFVSIKILWCFCLMVSFGGCAWFMIKSINDYLKNDVVTSFRVNYMNELTFPVIGICNLNFFNKQSANDLVRQKMGDKPDMIAVFPLRFLALDLFKGNKSVIDLSPNDVIIKCVYSTENCNNTNDFEIYYDYQYGACLRYNSGINMKGDKVKQKTVFASGSSYGLEIELFVGDIDENNNMFSIEHGFNIFIQNQSDFDSFSLEGVKISPGTSTRIILSKNSWKKEPKPYSDCIINLISKDSYPSETYKDSFSPNKTYSYFNCWKTCQTNFIKNICNCTIQDAKKNLRSCYSDDNYFFQDLACTKMAFKQFPTNPIYLKECDCPIECSNTYYTYTTSYSQFPTLKYSSYLLETDLIRTKYPDITYEEMKKSVARVQIFYDEMKEIVIEESVKTEMSDLISNLGGLLGLFLGISFLSLIEFVEVFLQALFVSVKNKNHETALKK